QYSRSAGDQAAARRSLLPPECVHSELAAVAGAQGRDSDPAEAFYVANGGAICTPAAATVTDPDDGVPRSCLAGKPARVEQLHQAVSDSGRREAGDRGVEPEE